MSLAPFEEPSYGITVTLREISVDEAVVRATEALATEGFGVLSEIDVGSTLHSKLGASIGGYRILGACSPTLAHQALQAEPGIGLIMPCNVVIAEQADGSLAVSVVDPVALFRTLDRDDLTPFAQDVRAQLARVMERLADG